MKNNLLLTLIFLSAVACENHSQFDFSKVPRVQTLSSASPEGPAVNSCLMQNIDALEVDNAINEKLSVEKQTTQSLVLGGKRINALPASSHIVLSKFGKYLLGSNPPDIATCSDLNCILEKAHNSKSREAALFSHSWYLNTGYWLSQTKQMPHLNTQLNLDEHHQFSLEELKAFYQLGVNLPDALKRLRTLQSIHRLKPNTFIPEYGESACGLAYSDGSVLLMDSCLRLSATGPAKGDFFFEAVTHEIAHHYAYSNQKIDESEEWKAFSGWTMTDFVKPDGKIERKWQSDPAKEGFARAYAGTTPAEDWADSVAYALMDADDLKGKAPKKTQFINQKIFANRSYDKTSLIDYYATTLAFEALAHPQTTELVKSCMSLNEQELQNFSQVDDEFAALLPEDSSKYGKCISQRLFELFEKLDQKLESSEFFYCEIKQNPTVKLYRYVTTSLASRITDLVKQNNPLAPWLPKLKSLSESFDRSIYPAELAYQCLEQNPKDQTPCFQQKLIERLTQLAEEQQFTQAELFEQLKLEVLKRYSHDEAKNSLKTIYLSFLSGLDGNLTALGSKLWQDCNVASDEIQGELLYAPFSGGSLFVPPGTLQCLNTRLDGIFKQATRSVAGKLGLDFKSEGAWNLLSELFWKNLISPVESALASEHQREIATAKPIFEQINSTVIANVANFQRKLNDPREFANECELWFSSAPLPKQTDYRFLNIYALTQEKLRDCQFYKAQIVEYQATYLAKSERKELSLFKKIIDEIRDSFIPEECKSLSKGQKTCINKKTDWAAYRAEARKIWLRDLPNQNIGKKWETKLVSTFKAATGF